MPSSETNTSSLRRRVEAEAEAIRREVDRVPAVAVIADPGFFAPLADGLETVARLSLGEVRQGRQEERGVLLLGRLEGALIALTRARHLFHGFTAQEAAFPVRVLAVLGSPAFVLLGSATPLGPRRQATRLMLVTDHLNMQGVNPLTGANEDDWGPRFPDMTAPYDADWRDAVREEWAREQRGGALQQGIYAGVPGPAPATPAEQAMLQHMGAEVVGTGVVPEVLTARHMGRRVLAAVAPTGAHARGQSSEAEAAGVALVKTAVRCAEQKQAASPARG